MKNGSLRDCWCLQKWWKWYTLEVSNCTVSYPFTLIFLEGAQASRQRRSEAITQDLDSRSSLLPIFLNCKLSKIAVLRTSLGNSSWKIYVSWRPQKGFRSKDTRKGTRDSWRWCQRPVGTLISGLELQCSTPWRICYDILLLNIPGLSPGWNVFLPCPIFRNLSNQAEFASPLASSGLQAGTTVHR